MLPPPPPPSGKRGSSLLFAKPNKFPMPAIADEPPGAPANPALGQDGAGEPLSKAPDELPPSRGNSNGLPFLSTAARTTGDLSFLSAPPGAPPTLPGHDGGGLSGVSAPPPPEQPGDLDSDDDLQFLTLTAPKPPSDRAPSPPGVDV